jgi:hypothetical protein
MRVMTTGMLETVRALSVLALIFLAFGHAPQVAAEQGSAVTAFGALSVCGNLSGDPLAHAPCHACRIGAGAALPLPPEPCARVALPVHSDFVALRLDVPVPKVSRHSARPRAPPVTV